MVGHSAGGWLWLAIQLVDGVPRLIAIDHILSLMNDLFAPPQAPSADAASVAAPMSRGRLKLVVARLSVTPNKAAGSTGRAGGRATARSSRVAPFDVTADGRGVGASGLVEEAAQERHKVRLRPLSSGSAANMIKVREATAADATALYRCTHGCRASQPTPFSSVAIVHSNEVI